MSMLEVRSKWDLAAALMGTAEVRLRQPDGTTVVGRVLSVELEDGSGTSFNVVVGCEDYSRKTVYLKLVG